MILSGHDAIAGLDLKYVQIRWFTRGYPALRVENLFCSYTRSATLPSALGYAELLRTTRRVCSFTPSAEWPSS